MTARGFVQDDDFKMGALRIFVQDDDVEMGFTDDCL